MGMTPNDPDDDAPHNPGPAHPHHQYASIPPPAHTNIVHPHGNPREQESDPTLPGGLRASLGGTQNRRFSFGG